MKTAVDFDFSANPFKLEKNPYNTETPAFYYFCPSIDSQMDDITSV
jgi:hypothetical protein